VLGADINSTLYLRLGDPRQRPWRRSWPNRTDGRRWFRKCCVEGAGQLVIRFWAVTSWPCDELTGTLCCGMCDCVVYGARKLCYAVWCCTRWTSVSSLCTHTTRVNTWCEHR